MELSRYIKQYSFPDDPGYVLLYSTKKAAKVLLQKSVFKDLESGTLPSEKLKTLHETGFIVESRENEALEMFAFLEGANRKSSEFKATIILNLDCNLKCIYCYEGDLKGKVYMPEDIADNTIAFIDRQYLSTGKIKHLSIDFYGGEPLLSTDLIRYISERLRRLADKHGTEYSFTLVTNGTLATAMTVENLLSYGLKALKITIDGSRENHNKYRPFTTDIGSFDVIINNIKDICGLVNVNITGNYTQDNYIEFPALLDYLIFEGITPEKVSSVRFEPVSTSPFNRSEFNGSCNTLNEQWIFEATLFLREEILKRGFNVQSPAPSTCMVEIENSITVNHDGELLKCTAFIGWEGLGAGNVRTGLSDYKKTNNSGIWKQQNCLDCEYLPMCYGGCKYLKLLKDGNIDGINCEKPYLDATLETLVKQDLRYSRKIGPQ